MTVGPPSLRVGVLIFLALLGLAGLACSAAAQAQAPAAASKPRVQQHNEQILNELKQIRQLLEKMAAQPTPMRAAPDAPEADVNVVLKAELTDYVIGNAAAPLTLVEYTDLECPFCRSFYVETFERIKREYIDTGMLRYVSRDFPLVQIHPQAQAAAKAARCAGEQQKFWEMRHVILVNNEKLAADSFLTFAQDLRLNSSTFAACLADPVRHASALKADRESGSAAGVNGTPSFVLGRTSAGGVDGMRIVGAQPFDVFDARIKLALAQK